MAEAYAIRGVVHFIQGGLNLSLEDFEVYCRLKKDDPLGHNNRAFILFQLGRTAEAERAWKRATKLTNASHYAFAGHAIALQKLKRYMQAKSKFQIAINMDTRWSDDIQGIAKEFLWTDEMIRLAQEIAKQF